MCVNYPLNQPAIGIAKKIRTQIEAFQKLGYQVTYSAYIDEGVAILEDDKQLRVYPYSKFNFSRINIIRRFLLMDACADYLHNRVFELGYIRWDAIDRKYLSVLKSMHLSCKNVVMDSHGYFKGYRGSGIKGKYIAFFTRLNAKKISKSIDLVIAESNEIEIFGVRVMKIDTGIDVNQYKCHKYVGNKNELNMISVANETVYHGYDRLIKGIFNYKKSNGNIPVKLHLVGKMENKTIKLISRLKLEDSVFLHGYQTGKNLELIYQQCNLGVGPLAPQRIGGKEGTGIKTKEYFAIGLPYFYAGQELLVPDKYPYVHRVEADDSAIDIKVLLTFYESIKNSTNMETDMRNFAKENFSWEKNYCKVLNILEEK